MRCAMLFITSRMGDFLRVQNFLPAPGLHYTGIRKNFYLVTLLSEIWNITLHPLIPLKVCVFTTGPGGVNVILCPFV
jgi:hypothetical protein